MEGEEVTMSPIVSLPEEEGSPTLEMGGEVVTMFPIASLPEEVRGRIYNFLVQKEAMKYRGVCRQWQEEIHTYYNFHLYLHEGNPNLQDIIGRQRITDCTTGTFLLNPSDRTSIFKRANLIQSLTVYEPSISPENLQALVFECAKSLKRLEIHLTKDLLRFEHQQDHFNFPNLRSLVVFVDIVHPYEDLERSPVLQAHVDQEVLLINRLIRDSHKPKLTNLSIKLYLHNQLQVDWYSSSILSTVANHSKTLSRIDLDFQHAGTPPYLIGGTFPSYQLEKKDRDRIRKADNLSCLNILICGRSDNVLGSLGELSITQKLERLTIRVTQFEWAFPQEVCWNCFETLVSINVTFSHSTASKTFDASCLQDCKSLKELSLGRQWKEEMNDRYIICNFHLLPESIDILKIKDVWILTTELVKISFSGLKNLQYLQLMGCGVSALYGVDGEVVQKLFLLPKLKNFEVNNRRYRYSDQQVLGFGFEDFKISIEGDGDPQKTGICITSHYSRSDAGVVDLGLSSEWMMSQKKLERLRIHVGKFEWVFLQEVCGNCFETLVSINVTFSHSATSKTFDASCLKDCENLELLVLRHTRGMGGSYIICNLQLLPESIVEFRVESILILTTELVEISSSGFRKLEQLHLMGCGRSGLYGVDREVFKKVLLLPNLRNFEANNIFNYHDYQEEANLAEFDDLKISVESDDPQETCIPITSVASYDTDAGAIDLGLPPEWMTMSQKKLEKLKIHVEKFESICLEKIGWKWFGSLFSIEVMFTHSTNKTFDASCLKDCGSLKELVLRRIPGEMDHCDNSICNFHLLPESIETLMIDSIFIVTTELEEAGFKNLKHLELKECGVYGLYGVDWKVFQKLLLLPKLCFLVVKDLNLSDSDEEANFISFSLRRNCWGDDRDYWVAVERSSPSCDSWRLWDSRHSELCCTCMWD